MKEKEKENILNWLLLVIIPLIIIIFSFAMYVMVAYSIKYVDWIVGDPLNLYGNWKNL